MVCAMSADDNRRPFNNRLYKVIRKTGIYRNTYFVNASGEIGKLMSDRMIRIIKSHTCSQGYHSVNLGGRQGQRVLRVARIVANAYHGLDWNSRNDTHHKDKNLDNNHKDNIEVLTHRDHMIGHLGKKVRVVGRNTRYFDSATLAAEYLGVSRTYIGFALTGRLGHNMVRGRRVEYVN